MTKILINELEYETDNFSEEQISLVNEMLLIKRKLEDIDYDKALYSLRNELLLKSLEESLKENKEESDD